MKRWMPYVNGMAEEPEGPYVLWEDHAAEIETMVEYAHRLEDRCVAAEAEAQTAEARADTLEAGIHAVEGLIAESRGVAGLHLNGAFAEFHRDDFGENTEEWEHHRTHDDCWICALLARADAFLRGSGAEVARKELLGALAVASLLKAAGHALRSYQYGNGSTELAKNIADKIDAAFADVPPAPSRGKGARE